jgi:hypothetical protein
MMMAMMIMMMMMMIIIIIIIIITNCYVTVSIIEIFSEVLSALFVLHRASRFEIRTDIVPG